MRLASIRGGGPDGTLVVVSGDGSRVQLAGAPRTLREAVEGWSVYRPVLQTVCDELNAGHLPGIGVEDVVFESPLPRSFHWSEGSSYLAHMERIRRYRGVPVVPDHLVEPVAYHSGSSRFLGPNDEVPLVDEAFGLDIEATVAVVTGDVPAASSAETAAGKVLLVMLANDFTLRNLVPGEYAKNLGLYQAKPTRSFAPFAVTPDELGSHWRDGLLHATLHSEINETWLGDVRSEVDVSFSFPTQIEYMVRTKPLDAGSIIGSGTVSNRLSTAGYGCLAEKIAVEVAERGSADTGFLKDGDRIYMEAFGEEGWSPFGAIRQVIRTIG